MLCAVAGLPCVPVFEVIRKRRKPKRLVRWNAGTAAFSYGMLRTMRVAGGDMSERDSTEDCNKIVTSIT